MGTIAHPACKVLGQMAERKVFLNFGMKFYGVVSKNVWHIVVFLVCKVEWFCEKPKRVESRICFNVTTLHPYIKELRKN